MTGGRDKRLNVALKCLIQLRGEQGVEAGAATGLGGLAEAFLCGII
jgi:hypothetical protein